MPKRGMSHLKRHLTEFGHQVMQEQVESAVICSFAAHQEYAMTSVTSIQAASPPNPTSSDRNELAGLQSKLKELYAQARDLSQNSNLSASEKEAQQKLLQAQIQQVMAQIAAMQDKQQRKTDSSQNSQSTQAVQGTASGGQVSEDHVDVYV